LSESSTEDSRAKFSTPEVFVALVGKLSDLDPDVQEAAVDVVGKLLEHGWFDFQIGEESITSISDRGLPDQVPKSQHIHYHYGQVE
jgi:hypothetical protein